jgi:hypothetical protein
MLTPAKKKIEFVRSFTSEQFGNVWIGRRVIVTTKQAIRFMSEGLAQEVQDGKRGNTGAGKTSSAGNAN